MNLMNLEGWGKAGLGGGKPILGGGNCPPQQDQTAPMLVRVDQISTITTFLMGGDSKHAVTIIRRSVPGVQ